ncbi:MAG: hypothetical protein WC374_10325 [Phycisphaerae bacterium]|jgi:hypothetical protein
MTPEQLEKYSSAITLSDMEVFVFPELMYSLVLANIMSPKIWQWRQTDTFEKLQGKDSYKILMRLKQFIMDEYDFNLDLETWGLTTREKEIKRFEKFIPPDQIAASNALFGYEGDKYYFDVDIRRHFGLDKYNTNIIPYWKTETVEAMDAFRLKPGYKSGAGECVSLSTLYAAAAYIVCGIAPDDIYMILTPLHSQNYIDVKDGVLTNNRRLVTKTMWFNGTALTDRAQRAIRHENVTIVAHPTGYVHCLYSDATINPAVYEKFTKLLTGYLTEKLSLLTIANFLRWNQKYQQYFQFCCEGCRDGERYAKAEVLFHYEHGTSMRVADDTFEKLIEEIGDQDVMSDRLPDRMCCQQLIAFCEYENLDVRNKSDWPAIKKYLGPFVPPVDEFLKDLADFLRIEPKLPSAGKNFIATEPIKLNADMQRQDVIDYLQSMRGKNPTADLAFYTYRDMQSCDWTPFTKAAVERSPVSIDHAKSMSEDEIYNWLNKMPAESIYDASRLAQPDEVANYKTGDGLEKAFLLANILRSRAPQQEIRILADDTLVVVKAAKEYKFPSDKHLANAVSISPDGSIKTEN